ncbi:unnamed protein product [Linum trigynum]|uniref:Uncharacterized protein n=1 Tax=Linum trigynum TaxID=586398 RepID=A0AAV2DWJ1_9ROSI
MGDTHRQDKLHQAHCSQNRAKVTKIRSDVMSGSRIYQLGVLTRTRRGGCPSGVIGLSKALLRKQLIALASIVARLSAILKVDTRTKLLATRVKRTEVPMA